MSRLNLKCLTANDLLGSPESTLVARLLHLEGLSGAVTQPRCLKVP